MLVIDKRELLASTIFFSLSSRLRTIRGCGGVHHSHYLCQFSICRSRSALGQCLVGEKRVYTRASC